MTDETPRIELTDAEAHVLEIINQGCTTTPALILTAGNRVVVAEAHIIAKLKDMGLLVRAKSDECEEQEGANLPHAKSIEAWACIHGTVHLELRDHAGAPFAIAAMPFAEFERAVTDVCGQMDRHIRAGHVAPLDARKH